MIKSKHKLISVVICLAMIFGVLFMLPHSAGAATGDTIYVKLNNGWSNVYVYMWTSGSGENNSWPGIKMTETSVSGVYTYKVTGSWNNIVFNNGNSGSGNQTGDLVYTGNGGDGKIYDLKKSTWSDYSQSPSDPTDPTTPTTPTTPTNPSEGPTVYLKNTAGWSSPNCYMWNTSSDANKGWPGESMTSLGDDVWMYTASKSYANCIFNGGGNQTDDLDTKDGYIYDNSTKKWSIYDTSPIRVTSYTADPAANIYKGMEVVLSASATSTGGTVSYKISAGNTVLKDYGTSGKTTWTPTSTGSFTITFDFKDASGNTNQRTLSLTVLDDTTVSVPVIKKVTPSDDGYVKTNQSATINVTAGGGKTGTNLLFYKYVIEDPNGTYNTAYYTLNSSYSFTPSKEGAYKVTVHVQASDNSEATKSFTVNATGGELPTEPTEPTEPTQPTQPTQPTETTEPPQPSSEPVTTIRGDLNGDGIVNIKDATYLQKILAEYNGYSTTLEVGDVNQDGRISIKDVTAIQRICAEMIA